MMKKLLVIVGIIVGLIVAAVAGLTFYVKSYLQSDKLKALILPKVEQATGRKAGIDSIDVSIFSGISVQGIHLKERDGIKDFVSANKFVLKYELMPLLSKQLIISSINVIDPAVSVSRDASGKFNYEDIVEHLKAGQKEEKPKQESGAGIPFSVVADKIGISNAKVDFSDAKKELPNVAAVSDADLKVAAGTEPGSLKFSGKANLKSLDVVMGSISTRTSGVIEFNPETITYALNTAIGTEIVEAKGSVKDYLKAPDVRLDLYSKKLDLAKLMAMGGGAKHEEKPGAKSGKTTAGKGKPVADEKKMDIKATGDIKVDTATYEGYTMNNFAMKYRYGNGVANIDPMTVNFASGQKMDLAGVMKGVLVFHYLPDKGEASDQIKRSLTGKMAVDLSKLQVKESKITDAVAMFTGLEDLRRPSFDKGHFDLNIKDQKTLISGQMSSPRIKVVPSGTVTFTKALDMLADIEVSPELASKMKVARFTGFMESKDGWTLIPLKITGTTDKPSVGPNQAALKKQLQKGIQSEIEKRLFKGGSQQGDKSQNLLKGLLGK
ncbi:MAG TPA: AsmA family protein [Dissulfurispiraceae bacterium]|nr:AsmA family protein [Dissulfurispiraceae bacterium]